MPWRRWRTWWKPLWGDVMSALLPVQADLLDLLGPGRAFFDADTRALYASDETPRACLPEAVLFPAGHADVAAIVALANRHGFALVARGAGSGNVGGALPAPGSVVVSFECMNRVLEFDPANRLVVVQPGVVTDDINLFWLTNGAVNSCPRATCSAATTVTIAAGQGFFENLPYFLTYTSNWFIERDAGTRVIFYFAWSLATEEQFYLVWPSVVRFARRWWAPVAVMASLLVAHLAGSWAVSAGLVSGASLPMRIASTRQ